MKDLRTGDRVKFLNDTGSGIVRKVLDKDTVLVETEDGFDFPVLKEELFLSVPSGGKQPEDGRRSKEPQLQQPPQQEVPEERKQEQSGAGQVTVSELKAPEPARAPEEVAPDVYAGLIRRDDLWELYVINDSKFYLWYWISLRSDSLRYPAGQGWLEPDTKVLIGELDPQRVFGAGKGIACFLFPCKEEWYHDMAPLEGLINPDIRNAVFVDNEFFEEEALVVTLKPREEYTREDLPGEKLRKTPVTGDAFKDRPRVVLHKNKRATPATPEVDLHINKLVDHAGGMSPGEILETQLARFHIALEGAVKAGQKKIIFIHGLGAGKLKQRIRKIIDTEYKNFRYQDASFKEYGYGATMILIR